MNLLLAGIMQILKKEVECYKTYNVNKNENIIPILEELKKTSRIKMKELEKILEEDDELDDDDEEEEGEEDEDDEEGEEDEGEEEEK